MDRSRPVWSRAGLRIYRLALAFLIFHDTIYNHQSLVIRDTPGKAWAHQINAAETVCIISRIHGMGSDQDLHTKNHTTQTRAKYHLNGSPALSCQLIQVAGEGDARQQIGEENIHRARKNELIESRPI